MKYRKKMMLIEQLHALTNAYDANALFEQQQRQEQRQQQQSRQQLQGQQQQQQQPQEQQPKQEQEQHQQQQKLQKQHKQQQDYQRQQQWAQNRFHYDRVSTAPRPSPLPGKEILHKNLFPTTISDSSSYTSPEGVYVSTTASPIPYPRVKAYQPSYLNK